MVPSGVRFHIVIIVIVIGIGIFIIILVVPFEHGRRH